MPPQFLTVPYCAAFTPSLTGLYRQTVTDQSFETCAIEAALMRQRYRSYNLTSIDCIYSRINT